MVPPAGMMTPHMRKPALNPSSGVAALAMLLTRVDPLTLAAGVYRFGSVSLDPGSQVVFYRDGKTASVALYQTPDGKRRADHACGESRHPQLHLVPRWLGAGLHASAALGDRKSVV